MTAIVPLQAVPSQVLKTALSGQSCELRCYQKVTGLYLDLLMNDVVVLGGVICLDRVLIVRDLYFGFIGDLAFVDTQGTEDPQSAGIGSRWLLFYLSPVDFR